MKKKITIIYSLIHFIVDLSCCILVAIAFAFSNFGVIACIIAGIGNIIFDFVSIIACLVIYSNKRQSNK